MLPYFPAGHPCGWIHVFDLTPVLTRYLCLGLAQGVHQLITPSWMNSAVDSSKQRV